MPAWAAYAANAPPAFPADGIASFRMPNSLAMLAATASPRALKEPVGFRDSSFKYKLGRPSFLPRRRAWISGVNPSPKHNTEESRVTGRTSPYRHSVG